MPRLRFRRDTAENWLVFNPILHSGEPGFESDTGFLKIGNSVDAWVDLEYLGGGDNSGQSAYEVAVENGYLGDEVSWLASLVGPAGPAGTPGTPGTAGPTGPIGADGAVGPIGSTGATGLVKVYHGTVATTARPTAPLVYWIGTANPINALPDDFWLEV